MTAPVAPVVASDTSSGWSDAWPLLLGAALALIGSLIATWISQRHQRRMAEDARVEARRTPARVLILEVLRLAREWGAASEQLDRIKRGDAFELEAWSSEAVTDFTERLDLSRQGLGIELSNITAEAWLVFQERPLLDPIQAIQVTAREPDSGPGTDIQNMADYDSNFSGRTIRMGNAMKELHEAAAKYLRTPLAEPPK